MSDHAVGDGDDLLHRFHVIVDQITNLDPYEIDKVERLAQVGEFAIALENLCTQLFEFDVVVSPPTVDAIRELGGRLGVADRYWTSLRSDAEPQ